MSLYNREILARHHNGVFNRGLHHPVPETSSDSDSSPEELGASHDLGGINVGHMAPDNDLPPFSPTARMPPLIPSPTPLTSSDPLSESSSPSPIATSTSLPQSSSASSVSVSVSDKVVSSPSFSPAPVQTSVPVQSSQHPILDANSSSAPSSSSKQGLSSGAIGAIVTLVILFVAAIAAWGIRKVYIQRREFKRNTWGAGLVPALQTKRSTIYGDEKNTGLPSMQQREKSALSAPTPPLLTAPTPKIPSPPPQSYNSVPSPISAHSPAPVQSTSPSRTIPKADLAIVVRTFIPSLPDELNITTGEHIRILTLYDDGWALCSNMRNEQGVVPLECLQRAGMNAALQLQPQSEFGYGSDKATKRLSSLVPNANETY